MQTVYGKLNYIIKDQHEEIEELERQIAELNGQIAELNLQIESLQGDITLLTQQKEALEAQVVALQAQLQATTQYYLPYIQGTATEFISDTITSLRPYAFYYDTYITKVYLPNVETLPDSCFYNATNLQYIKLPKVTTYPSSALRGCSKLNPSIDEDGNQIPFDVFVSGYGGQGLGYQVTTEMIYTPNSKYVGSYGFNGSGITKIIGSLVHTIGNAVGDYAFQGCTRLKYIDLNISGIIGKNAFYNDYAVEYVDFSNSNITQFSNASSNSSFSDIGKNRVSPSTNILIFDFRKSTFSIIPGSLFGATQYLNIYFPSTVTTVYNFIYNANYNNVRFDSINPPTLNNSITLDTNKFFVPLDSYSDYHSATNWSALTLDVWKHYIAGDTLDNNYNWYSDIRLTNQVTGTAPETADYYGVAI